MTKSLKAIGNIYSLSGRGQTKSQEDPDLYLFSKSAQKPFLAFTKLLPTDFPLRALKGNGPTYCLLFVTVSQLQEFLAFKGAWRTKEQDDVNPLT